MKISSGKIIIIWLVIDIISRIEYLLLLEKNIEWVLE